MPRVHLLAECRVWLLLGKGDCTLLTRLAFIASTSYKGIWSGVPRLGDASRVEVIHGAISGALSAAILGRLQLVRS